MGRGVCQISRKKHYEGVRFNVILMWSWGCKIPMVKALRNPWMVSNKRTSQVLEELKLDNQWGRLRKDLPVCPSLWNIIFNKCSQQLRNIHYLSPAFYAVLTFPPIESAVLCRPLTVDPTGSPQVDVRDILLFHSHGNGEATGLHQVNDSIHWKVGSRV